MQTRQDLERRVREFEAEVARLRAGGTFAFGGGAVGWTAIGGGAVGTYAHGGGVYGEHVVSATRCEPQAHEHFARYGLDAICGAGSQARRAGGPPSAQRY